MRIIILFTLLLIIAASGCRQGVSGCFTCPNLPTDSTSHNISWTLQTFGDGSSSTVYDVAIINDSLAYAVGAVYFRDSLGVWDPLPYNLAKWNGTSWQLLRIQFYTICGQPSRTSYPASSIFAFNENDIWISMDGDQVARWNGNTQTATMCMPISFSIKKLWGESPSSIYAVGSAGTIVFYNGSSWTKIESGTTLPINDIYGAYNSTTKQWEILAVAGNAGSGFERKIIKLDGTKATALSDNPIAYTLSGVWFVPCQYYYVVGSGIYEKRNLADNAWLNGPLDITTYYTTKIRGNAVNDVFAVGAYGEVMHYNGNSWHSFRSVTAVNGAYGSISTKNNLLMVAGYDDVRAVIAIGRR